MPPTFLPTFLPTLILPVPPSRWQPPAAAITVDGLALAPKAELHITVIGNSLGRELQATFGRSVATEMIADAYVACDWGFARSGRQLLLRKLLATDGVPGPVFSVIELVYLPAMAAFHHALGRRLGRQLPVPPAHVTLYTAGRDNGIGVASPRRLRAFTVGPLQAQDFTFARPDTVTLDPTGDV